ncbi:MAG: hypothetical protein ABI151_00900 [Chitinophagaceae bacterium]
MSPNSPSTQQSTDKPVLAPGNNQGEKTKIGKNDIAFNVTPKEAMIRFGLMLLLPIVVLFADKHLVIYVVPVSVYLFISSVTRICVIKYLWRRVIKKEGPISSPAYGKDISYPDESSD